MTDTYCPRVSFEDSAADDCTVTVCRQDEDQQDNNPAEPDWGEYKDGFFTYIRDWKGHSAYVKTRKQELENRTQHIASVKMAAMKTLADAKREFATHRAWKMQTLDDLGFLPFQVKYEMKIFDLKRKCNELDDMETLEEKCWEREFYLQLAWEGYRDFEELWVEENTDDSTVSTLKSRLDGVETSIVDYLECIETCDRRLKDHIRKYHKEREMWPVVKVLKKLQEEEEWIQCFNEACSECEEYVRELQLALAEARFCASEAKKCADVGNVDGQQQWEIRRIQMVEHIEELREEIAELCDEDEEDDIGFVYPDDNEDENLVEME